MLGMVVWGMLLGMSGLRGCWLGIVDIFLDPFVEYRRGADVGQSMANLSSFMLVSIYVYEGHQWCLRRSGSRCFLNFEWEDPCCVG